MVTFHKSDPLRLMGRRLLIVLMFILVLWVLWAVWNIYRKNAEASRLRTEAQAQLADLSQRQSRIQTDLHKLETNRGVEEALRQQYAVGAAGEGMIMIVETENQRPQQATSSVMQWLKNIFSW